MATDTAPNADAQNENAQLKPAQADTTVSATGSSAPPYRYQFSAATRNILNRLKNGDGTIDLSSVFPSAHVVRICNASSEDVDSSFVGSLDTSATLPMPTPAHVASRSIAQAFSPVAGDKRKRTEAHDDPGAARRLPPRELQTSLRPAPKPPAKRKRLKNKGMCARCTRSYDMENDRRVACTCGHSYHQRCHVPVISEQVADDPASFKCEICVLEEEDYAKFQVELARWRKQKHQFDLAKRRERALEDLPHFIKPEIIGFTAGDADFDTKREYFSGLTRTELVNLLLFSDQIEPGLLVNVLTSVSQKHPDLPIFGFPDLGRPNEVPIASPQVNIRQETKDPPAPPKTSKQRSKTGGVRRILKTAPVPAKSKQTEAEKAEADKDEDDAPIPETWPKAGEGLYALLPLEKEDAKYLVDDNDEEAFSHFMVDINGKQIFEPIAA